MHAVQEGAASKSYGLAVASLAGVPKTVIQRAKTKLRQLEASGHEVVTGEHTVSQPAAQLSLLPELSEVEKALADVDPDNLTPRQALEALYRLKALL